jgi:hypothetical protein
MSIAVAAIDMMTVSVSNVTVGVVVVVQEAWRVSSPEVT